MNRNPNEMKMLKFKFFKPLEEEVEEDNLMSHQELLALKKTNKFAYIYFLFNDQKIVYIGQTTNLQKRISEHKTKWLGYRGFDSFASVNAPLDESERLSLEKKYIEKFNPKNNTAHRVKNRNGCLEVTTNQTFTNQQEQ
jgi:excinuclease UvrABC nuclease subunit